MDELIKQSGVDLNLVSTVATWDMVLVLVLSTFLATAIAYTYVHTHSGISYSASFAQTIVFVGFTIALIMVIIGSNVARAFALVGAMSIVRFRNPVKDSRDVAFLFMAMAVGMAVGTKFYVFSTIFTAFGCFIAVLFHRFGFGTIADRNYVLRLRMAAEVKDAVQQILAATCSEYTLVSVDPLARAEGGNDYIYELRLKRGVDYETVLDRITALDRQVAVSLLIGAGAVDA
ncbi:MAG: DUF4956 domain-containing protein [Proteobacteria bacterium]|nr:DUF4956 domain-containing protein [Pseudomonadota bacterium]